MIALATLLLTVAGCGSAAIDEGESLRDFTDSLAERVVALMDAYAIPGATVALIDDGVLVWSDAFGYADVEAGRPMTTDAVNRAESISKSVTAWGVARLVQQGRLELDDPVSHYLETWEPPGAAFEHRHMTVRQLLSHTAGLASGSVAVHYPPDGVVPSLKANLTREFDAVAEPGSSFLYSNVGFNLLELLIEEVTDEQFASYMEREVLRPLGMDDSSYAWRDDRAARVPVGYDLAGARVPAYVYPEQGSGGLLATVEDLARFVSAGMTGSYEADQKVLRPEVLEQLYHPEVRITGLFGLVAESYGLGHFLETSSNGERAVWHGGQGHGWMTHFHSVPSTGDGIVITTNSQRSWPMIAQVLGDWSDWNGHSPVGMTLIARAQPAARGLIVLAAAFIAWRSWWLVRGLIAGGRRVAPLSRRSRAVRAVQGGLALTMLAYLVWRWAQVYRFESSIFPGAIVWLDLSLLGVAVVLALSASMPAVPAVPTSPETTPATRR